jgi:hypothetical protein
MQMIGKSGIVDWDLPNGSVLHARVGFGPVGEVMIVTTADHAGVPDPVGCRRIKTSEFYALREAAEEARAGGAA